MERQQQPTRAGSWICLEGMAATGPRYGYYTCCANETGGSAGDAVIGYWNNRIWTSEDPTGDGYYGEMQMSMTAKLILGRPLEKLYRSNSDFHREYFVWPEPPSLLRVNCTPFIEHANASVLAELESGVIHSYKILEQPQNATEA